jgi:hypothetical protein
LEDDAKNNNDTQAAKRENTPQKLSTIAVKKGRGRKGWKQNSTGNIVQPLSEQNPPANV